MVKKLFYFIKSVVSYTGSNIEEFAKINEMVIAKKNICVGKLPVVMAGVGVAYADKYIQKLQEHDYTVVIYKQDINGGKTTRSLSEIISPGTFFPNETENLSNNIMCIWLHKSKANKRTNCQVTLGIANIDIYTGKTSLFQFAANYIHSPATYDELERYISAYRPSECLFVANMPERLIDDIIGFVGLEKTKIHKVDISISAATISAATISAAPISNLNTFAKNAEKQVYQIELLKKYYPHLSALDEMFPTHYIAIQSFCFLLDFVCQHNPNLIKKLADPVLENYTDKLILANHSLHQLNMIDDSRHTGRLRSVSSLLNNCVTTMGKRHFLYQLHYPITHEPTLLASYDITEHLLLGENWLAIRNKLSSVTDLEKFARKIVTRKIVPKNLASLVDDLLQIEEIYNEMAEDTVLLKYLNKEQAKEQSKEQSKEQAHHIKTMCQHIYKDITRVFNLEECKHLSDMSEISHIINKDISPTIDGLIDDSINGMSTLQAICNYFSGLIQATETTSKAVAQYIKIHETAKSDAILMGTSRRIAILKSALKKLNKPTITLGAFELDLASLDYISSNKKDVVITSPQIRAIARQNEEAKDKIVREIQLVFQSYIVKFIQFETELQQIIKYVTEMDMLQCKCFIAHKYNYCKPTIQTEASKSFFAFTGIRHPLIEHLQTNELYVTNDLAVASTNEMGTNEMGTNEMGTNETEAAGILLYGTNAVGKTSFIKSVGIAVIMAQAGLYVPCISFTYKPYQNIFTRILGNDNLFKGLSTFAVEMTELRTILTMANQNSLVLGDELCSGTESDSALSIFTAGLEILHEKNSTFLFATHFHEIMKYEEIKALPNLKAMHMAVHYNRETNALVYDRKLREGPGESMYGLEVCKSLNLPDAFLQRAHDIRMKYCPEKHNVLSLSPTHFNTRKLVGNCEICEMNKASEVHHLQHQKNASEKNEYIQTFHKNHKANLLNICESCHHKIHKTKQQHKVVKTTAGYRLSPLI